MRSYSSCGFSSTANRARRTSSRNCAERESSRAVAAGARVSISAWTESDHRLWPEWMSCPTTGGGPLKATCAALSCSCATECLRDSIFGPSMARRPRVSCPGLKTFGRRANFTMTRKRGTRLARRGSTGRNGSSTGLEGLLSARRLWIGRRRRSASAIWRQSFGSCLRPCRYFCGPAFHRWSCN